MQRREFLCLSMGVAGISALADTTALANDKTLRLLRPNAFDLHYIGVSYSVNVERRRAFVYPRITSIEFRIRDRLITTLTAAPYNFSWVPVQADWGQGDFNVKAFAGSGNIVWSKTIPITMTNLPPGVTMS